MTPASETLFFAMKKRLVQTELHLVQILPQLNEAARDLPFDRRRELEIACNTINQEIFEIRKTLGDENG